MKAKQIEVSGLVEGADVKKSILSIQRREPVTRREFLNYMWGASAILLLGEASGSIAWFMSGRFKPRSTTLISGDPAMLIEPDAYQIEDYPKVWLSNTPQGFFAFHNLCTHLVLQRELNRVVQLRPGDGLGWQPSKASWRLRWDR